jgi:hypothetical protein
MTDEELKELVASLALKSDSLDAAQRETNRQMQATNMQMQETNKQMQATNETLKRIGIDLGNMKKNQGAVAEEFFLMILPKVSINGVVKQRKNTILS